MDKNTALTQITNYRNDIDDLEYRQRKAVIAAKQAGASWAEIGTALDLTKQRAHQKYAEPVAQAERMAKWKEENPEAAAAAAAKGRANAAARMAEIEAEVQAELAKKKTTEDHAAHVEATAIFLDGTVPAPENGTDEFAGAHAMATTILANETAAKTKKRTPGTAPATDWEQSDPAHFKTPMTDRPTRCTYCGQKNHRDKKGGTWIYPGCTPTTTDPSNYTEGLTK